MKKKTEKKKNLAEIQTVLDQKELNKLWMITKNTKNLKENASKIYKIIISLIDSCQYMTFKTIVYGVSGMSKESFKSQIESNPIWKSNIEFRLIRNRALETLRVLELISKSTQANMLICRLKLVSEECRNILNEQYLKGDEKEEPTYLTRTEKMEEMKKLMSKLGSDIERMVKKDEKDIEE